ncbi:sensor histidine kinase [Paenibacillus psychroresistens]|uniref:histidine kinase n=1 Tax=Paenibacillus psychroresistens TaxID=1778678 RepID=A0A6B8RQ63_9BACL|nr:sensor histidine kinase [Paenibacillus psychroresistens]QGQ98510.1 sensor histidine kinase [Paenibacillus psychroresistens]
MIKNLKLKTKLILTYVFTIVIPLMIIGEIILNVSGEQILYQATETAVDSSKQVNHNIKELFLQYADISNRLFYDQTLKSYLNPNKQYDGVLESINAYESYLKPIAYYDFNLRNNFATMKIFFLNKTLVQDFNNYIFADDDIRNTEEYKRAEAANGLITWGYHDHSIYLARALSDVNNEPIGVVSIEIPEKWVLSLIEESRKEDKLIMVSDTEGKVISSNDRNLIGSSIGDKPYFAGMMEHDIGSLDYKAEDYKIIYNTISGDNSLPKWKVITLIPVNKLLEQERRIKQIGITVCLISLLVSCVIFLFLLGKITKRIKTLELGMQRVKEGEFTTVADSGPLDEIGVMTRNFNTMVESLKRLIYENYEAKLELKEIALKKREAELYALQNQINPHFLFNTLESIRMKIINVGDNESSLMVLNLSKILRKSLNWQGEMIQLAEELEFVRNYLDIQKSRFKNKISYDIVAADELLEIMIPKLIIQPIVDNAIKHGIENKRGKGLIHIHIFVEEGRLIVSVADNGKGMSTEILERLRSELAGSELFTKKTSIGIKNVNDRIKLHYGAIYGLLVESIQHEGTTVTIILPEPPQENL